MLCTRSEGRGEVEASPEYRVPRSRHVVISSEMCVCLIMRKVKKKNIGGADSKSKRERGGGYIKNHMRVRKGRSFPLRALQSHWATYGRGPKRKHTCWDIQRGEKDGRWR